MRMWRSPVTIVCDIGASTIALTTHGQPSTSPQPTIPASVVMRISSASCELSVRALISGSRR